MHVFYAYGREKKLKNFEKKKISTPTTDQQKKERKKIEQPDNNDKELKRSEQTHAHFILR